VVVVDDNADGVSAAGAGDGDAPQNPRPSAPPSPTGGVGINAQLAQACELETKLAEEYQQVRLLRATIVREVSARGEHTHKLGKQAHGRINVDDPNTPLCASQKLIVAATLLRAMPAPSTPEARNLHREAQALIEQAVVQQAESSASRIRQQGSARDDGGAQGQEASVHAGGAVGQPANRGRTSVREQILDMRGQAQDGDVCNVINTHRKGDAEVGAAAGYHPRRGGRYDGWEGRSPTPEPWEPVCSAGRSARQASPSVFTYPPRSTSTHTT
jgi:hypothetical protein